MDTLKYYGRGVVLPVNEMKALIEQDLCNRDVKTIVDFGSGTLFWSQYFADDLGFRVLAVDNRYLSAMPYNDSPNIVLNTDILDVLANLKKEENNAIFICDVIHHLPPELWQTILPQLAVLFDVIIIKDIDATCKVGNFLNKMHDRIINGEKIENVYPETIMEHLADKGLNLTRKALPKLWYPHFFIIATKGQV